MKIQIIRVGIKESISIKKETNGVELFNIMGNQLNRQRDIIRQKKLMNGTLKNLMNYLGNILCLIQESEVVIERRIYLENLKGENNMEIVLIILVGALILCIGMIVGMFIDENINKSYYTEMVNIVANSLKEHNKIYDEFYKNMNTSYKEYFEKMNDFIVHNQKILASAMDEINKSCYVPIWKDINKELPECEGIYYGKKDNTNSMWKVIFRNNEWYLSGYPERKIDVIKWTELY